MNRIIQSRLLQAAAGFLILHALILTLSPAVRARTWDVEYRWSHWIAVIVWLIFAWRAHRDISKHLPDADPYLLPTAMLLSGWGILTVWRLDANFGARQTLWYGISLIVLIAGLRLSSLDFLRKYKYLLLTGGLLLTALTLLFGTNPSGFGPRLWLGCCNIYFQPSEPLKFLLITYLSAYLAEKLPSRLRMIHLLYPTLILAGVVIVLLLVQRDLGTASIFVALYTIMIYLATGRKRILLTSIFLLVCMGALGYFSIDIIRTRIDSWLNPWDDAAGHSYQIIQSLLAVANGDIEGRGPGLGSPGFIPVAISDFIYAVIAEETGLFGTLGMLALFGLILARGLRAALRAPDPFRRFLAAGITTYFGVQTILIVGGNLRLLPLTGVTLPFVSYGGSSLLTSFIALLCLLLISNHLDEDPAPLPSPQPYIVLSILLSLGLFAAALTNGWWAVIRGPDLLSRPDNPRRMIEERYVPRGSILDRSNTLIATTDGTIGTFKRTYRYVDLAPIIGYSHSRYGQAGIEAALDDYLRGRAGNPTIDIVLNKLLYGMSPPGLDVRLSIDLYLQYRADEMMIGHRGAVILMNAQSGEILVMASHPTFNPNHLDEIGESLITDPDKPLINRATLGQYPIGSVVEPFAHALFGRTSMDENELRNLYKTFGFYQAPQLRLQVAPPASETSEGMIRVSPLQVALASAALSNNGIMPAPRIAMAVNTPERGWITLPALGTPIEAVSAPAADEAALSYLADNQAYWQHIGQAQEDETFVTWFIGGTPPNWQAAPLVVVVALEEDNMRLAQRVGGELLRDAMNP
ncbi:MAG TPA: FtsW/RodA/SpoVE family cell cycle protein [Anaerolineales bacterium]|nr:FtsW/RodA/SpoVE family cell cycle protein [Anaerolineales bacterium]